MILVTDPICSLRFEEHLTFNKTLTAMMPSGLELCWTGDQAYGVELFKDLPHVIHYGIVYQPGFSFIEGIRRYLHIFKSLKKSKEAVSSILFLSADNTLFPLFCLLFYRSLRRLNVVCVIHNNLYTLSQSPLKRFLFRKIKNIVSFVVLSQAMKEIIDSLLATDSQLLHHPLYSLPTNPDKADVKNFLAIGRQGAQFLTGAHYDDFVAACTETLPGKKVSITILIPVQPAQPVRSVDNVDAELIVGYPDSGKYYEFFRDSSFVVFAEADDARFRASGVLVDAISSGCIFVAPNYGHFAEFAGCGILYDRGNFKDAIRQALLCTSEEFHSMLANQKKKKEEYSALNDNLFKSLLQ